MNPNNKVYQRATAEEQREWWRKNKEKVVTWEIKTVKEKYFANIYVNHKYLQSDSLQSHNYTQLNKKITTLTDNVTSVSIHSKILNQISIYGLLLKVNT